MFTQRLDNFLVQNNLCSKRSAKNFVLKNKICINDETEKNYKANINPQQDEIFVNEKKLETQKHIYLVMNKPSGYVCSTVSDRSKTVYELLENFKNENQNEFSKLHTIGRLDKDTEGLLLFTTDGNFSNHITRKENQIEKTYYVELENSVDKKNQIEYTKNFSNGIYLEAEKKSESFTTLPAKLNWLSENSCNLTIQEGKFHQVRRMFFTMNNFVTYLKRISIGKLFLDNSLLKGEYRELTEEEKFLLTNN
ncbi:MAG: rRNA pseudouridine synthase [Spirochaetaceae bacterium]|nr:rRNA pseudouridine synthase [Spirochaetaceae bacterium]